MSRIWTFVCAAALLTAVSACSGGDEGPATYSLSPRPARTLETPLPEHPVRLGEIVYSVMAVRTNIASVVGSHADWLPKGQFVRLRMSLVNEGRDRHEFNPSRQLLVTADGRTYKTSYDAMEIDRQPSGVLSIARDERREFDLWFDIPKQAKVRALRVVGDPMSSDLAEQLKGTPSPGTKDSVDIPLAEQ
jgi:hypothetical protein